MPYLTTASVRKAPTKAVKTAGKAQTKAVKTAIKAQTRAVKTAIKAQRKAVKTAGRTRARAVKTAGGAQSKALRSARHAAGRPADRREAALASTGRVARTGASAVVAGARVWWAGASIWLNQGSGPKRKTRKAPIVLAAAGGAGIQYLVDPADGKRRRRQLLDRGSSTVRSLARQGEQQARYTAGVANGAAHRATPDSATPVDDKTLADPQGVAAPTGAAG